MFRRVMNRERAEETVIGTEAVRVRGFDEFAAAEREAVEQAEADLKAALDARARLTQELEAEQERQLHETFDGERIVEFERRIAVAGKAIERARHRVSIASERLREKEAEHRRLEEARFRRTAEALISDLHGKLEAARGASERLVDLHGEAERALGVGQTAVPRGVWYGAILEDDRGPGDGGAIGRWRRYAGRRLRGEE
jgi:hypothetical protein